jgi:hypothetical protein
MSDATFTPYSGLGALLMDHMAPFPESAVSAQSCAETAAVSMAHGLAVVGKLLVHCDARQLGPCDWNSLGDLLVTMGETLAELVHIATDVPTAPT